MRTNTEEVMEKIEYEYAVWRNYTYALSYAELLGRAYEIAFKRALFQKIGAEINSLGNDILNIMAARKDFIGFAYTIGKDNKLLLMENEQINDKVFEKLMQQIIYA